MKRVRRIIHRIAHALQHLSEHMVHEIWNTMVNINSILLSCAALYTIYAAGASIYYVTLRPIELGVMLSFILVCTEIVFAAIEEVAG